MQVAVYSRCDSVRLELNGKVIGEKPVSDATELKAKFDVPYQPGELRAIGLTKGKPIASTVLRTAGEPKAIRLTADRSMKTGAFILATSGSIHFPVARALRSTARISRIAVRRPVRSGARRPAVTTTVIGVWPETRVF